MFDFAKSFARVLELFSG